MRRVRWILTPLVVTLLVMAAFGLAVRIYMGRDAENRLAPGEAVNLADLHSPLPKPGFLFCPPGYCPAAEAVAPPAGLDDLRTSFLTLVEPDSGDVDITAAEILVSVGRGIGSQDNLDDVQELADALGAPLSASRPVTDAGWLPKTRQVGKSGLKVKPKVYLTFGISGAPEHLEGMRDAELIIACNTDANAPIFDVAHYGTTLDLFDLVPAMTETLG